MKMYRHHDTLTYRFPRTTQQAFGLDATEAYAIRRYRKRQIILAKFLIRVGMVAWVVLMLIGLTA